MRSGPGGVIVSGSPVGGPSSSSGSVEDVGMLYLIVASALAWVMLMTNPRMSRIRMVTGQMMSNLSPREPAITSS